ncbi:MAG: spore cortex biosynthesis protein YabQ [Oscillospiraceae bacterium]|nr:spore cortex biosynthesis protein YabQ [Oscillospiraceae bacterium]
MGLYQTFHPVVFLWSLLWGVMIYAVYDILRAVRYINKNKMWVSVTADIFFMVISALFVFTFSLAYNFGETRIYMIFGMILSFLFLKLTVGRFTTLFICKIFSVFSKFVRKMFLIFKKVTTKVLKLFALLVYNLGKIRKKLLCTYFRKKGKRNEKKTKNT